MLALTSPTGKLGGAVLDAILENNLIDPQDLVICTSSDPSSHKLSHLTSLNIPIRHADFTKPDTLAKAYEGCTSLFLISTPAINLDFNNAPLWHGRESHHRAAIDAAVSAGVKHIYYTSLAFTNPSRAGVMRAHIRTEKYLHDLVAQGKLETFTILREGLYNESWPLYFGYYYDLKKDERKEVIVAGDGRISWTAIADMASVTAKILAAPRREWAGKCVYLSQKQTRSLADVADMVSESKGEEVRLKVVGRKEYEDFYVDEQGMERPSVEWWSSTYDALKGGECEIEDGTLEAMLGREPKGLEETVREMMG